MGKNQKTDIGVCKNWLKRLIIDFSHHFMLFEIMYSPRYIII